MTKAIRIHATGGPEVLRYEDVEVGQPGPGQVRLRHTAIGLNFIDAYFRSGLYPAPAGLPLIPGHEAAGVVVEVGPGLTWPRVGDRVAYNGVIGAYAGERLVAADRLVAIPEGIADEQAAAMMLKGMTAEFLLLRAFKVKPGDTVLFHAAAGGVGTIFGQWAKHLGATVIGTASSAGKIALAMAQGFDHVINYRDKDFVAEVREITKGAMCDVVYDSVGKDTFPGSLDCLKPRGMFVSFGQSSGPVPPFTLSMLQQRGSLYATRPTLFSYVATRAELEGSAKALFDVVRSGAVKIKISQRYALKDAALAHTDLEARRTTGATVIIP
jgi:NADPH2:quinone reductase